MGRYYYDRQQTVEECRDIDVFWLRKHGYFSGLKSGGVTWTRGLNRTQTSVGFTVNVIADDPYIQFKYVITDNAGKQEKYDYKIPLVTTPCTYGGERYWFICAITKNGRVCRRRVAKLFLAGYNYFGCRHCFNLSYDSRNKLRNGYYGYLTRMFDIEAKQRKLLEEIKIKYRKGKPTKKYQQYLDLLDEMPYEEIIEAHKEMNRRLGMK